MLSQTFGDVTLSNPRNAVQEPGGVIIVTIDYSDAGTEQPEEAVYALVENDNAPAAKWLKGLIDDGTLVVSPASAEYMNERYWADVRARRDELLAESDIEVLPDRWALMSPEEQHAWATYRQALRDIPESHEDPLQVEWPKKPA